MKTLSAIALASLFLIPAVHAADAKQPPATAEKKSAMMPVDPIGKGQGMMKDCLMETSGMQADLGLSPEQKQKMDAIHQEAMKRHQALREETHQKVLKVLTPEQAKKLEAHRKQMMEQRSDRMEKRAENMEMRADHMKKRADHMKEQAKEPAKMY
ncbi:MAG TPA: hypothetical protein DF427_07275 [Moraxellaceae bacterium]|nr:hypothetical protein [Moraxellaceae bacterium]